MLGCQSLGDLERYFESVTTHLSLGQPGAKIKRYINVSLFIEGFICCRNTLNPIICPSSVTQAKFQAKPSYQAEGSSRFSSGSSVGNKVLPLLREDPCSIPK